MGPGVHVDHGLALPFVLCFGASVFCGPLYFVHQIANFFIYKVIWFSFAKFQEFFPDIVVLSGMSF